MSLRKKRDTGHLSVSTSLALSSHLLWAVHQKVQLQVLAAEIQHRLCRDKNKTAWKGSLKSNGITKHTALISVSCHF